MVLADVPHVPTFSPESLPAVLPWKRKAMMFDIPGPPKTETRAHSPKPPFYKTARNFLTTLQALATI